MVYLKNLEKFKVGLFLRFFSNSKKTGRKNIFLTTCLLSLKIQLKHFQIIYFHFC